jgi:GT2 family glycosyltransferase
VICRAYVVHYGDRAGTLATVASLQTGDVAPDAVVVIDNQGGFAADGVEVMRPSGNVGFAGAIGLGSVEALRAGAAWAWFLNNDVVVAPGCLRELLAAGEAEPRAGLLTPVIEHEEGGIWYAGGEVESRSVRVDHATVVDGEGPYDTGYATGCAVLARAGLVREVGPPDERLFMYFEDVDWSLRARARGWRVLVVPAARVRHSVARRGGRRVWSPLAVYLLTRNRLLLARRSGDIAAALPPAASWAARQWIKAVAWRSGAAIARAGVLGLRDGLCGRCGPPPAAVLGRRP